MNLPADKTFEFLTTNGQINIQCKVVEYHRDLDPKGKWWQEKQDLHISVVRGPIPVVVKIANAVPVQ